MINGICEWKCFNYCENGGSCYIALKAPYCDCDNTGYHGKVNRVRLSLMNLSEMCMCERVETFYHHGCGITLRVQPWAIAPIEKKTRDNKSKIDEKLTKSLFRSKILRNPNSKCSRLKTEFESFFTEKPICDFLAEEVRE